MILTNRDILEFIEKGKIEIEPLDKSQIGSASVDLRVSNEWWVFKKGVKLSTSTDWREVMEFKRAESITLKPQEMCLGITVERIRLSEDISAFLQGRSRFARLGLSVHVTSAFVHPGVNNRQVLEIINNSPYEFEVKAFSRISQIIFFKNLSKTTKPYSKFGEIAINQ